MGKRRGKHKGRRDYPSFLGIPHSIVKSEEFGALRPWALKLLIEISANYRGGNNGDLSAAFSVLKKRGWSSPSTLSKSLRELEAARWILKTRQGGKNRCSLYAVTWWPMDESSKHPNSSETVASHDWKKRTA